MPRLLTLFLLFTITACSPFEPVNNVHIVVVDGVIESGVSGNIGHFPNSQISSGNSLPVFILGEPLPVNSRIPVHVVAVHDQVGTEGTIFTIITTTERDKLQGIPVLEDAQLRAELGKTLTDVQGSDGVSLGIRDEVAAHATIARYRDAYEGGPSARRFIRSVP